MPGKRAIGLLIVFLLLFSGSALAETIGWVTAFEGAAYVERPNVGKAVCRIGLGIEVGDKIVTQPQARVKVILTDDTLLNISGNTEFSVVHFKYSPYQGQRQADFLVEKGIARVLVEKNPRISTEVRILTPTAIASITGTTVVVEYLPATKTTYVLTMSGRVGVSSSLQDLPGVFFLADKELTTVVALRNPVQPRTAEAGEVARYEKATFIQDKPNLAKMPGRGGNVIDNPSAGEPRGKVADAFSKSLTALSEGEGGAEFDAFIVETGSGKISDTDLPLPGDLPGAGGPATAIKEATDKVQVTVGVQFKDDSDKKKKD